MKITKEGRFAIRGVLDLAQNSSKTDPEKVEVIANRMLISKIFLNKIFHRLLKAGVIASVRGRNGGYYLPKKANEISLYEVVIASGENLRPVLCSNHENEAYDCSLIDECLISPIWDVLGITIAKVMKRVTIENVLDRKAHQIVEDLFVVNEDK